MPNTDQSREQDQLEEHSLPGTNQAGKGPGPCEESDQKRSEHQDRLEKHSLPGTNQAGKEASSCEEND